MQLPGHTAVGSSCNARYFYFYSSNKWRAFYKQLNNKHCSCSIINKHVFREMTCEIYNQKWHNTHKDININTLDTHFRPELCGLQTQGLNNTYVRVCVVRVCVHVCECVFIRVRACLWVRVYPCARMSLSAYLSVCVCLSVYACSGVRVSETWSYVLTPTIGGLCL